MSDDEETAALAPMTPHGIAPSTFDGVWAMAERLATAKGFVPEAMFENPGAIAACVLTGLELGLGPMQALRSIHVIEGRPTLSADLMLSIALRGGVKHVWLATNNEEAHVKLERRGHEPFAYTFTVGDAERAGLMGKSNWRKYTAAMLRARCISAALRAYCPDVIGAGVYVEGEIEPWEPADVSITIVKEDEAPVKEQWTAMRFRDKAESADWCQMIVNRDIVDQTVILAVEAGVPRTEAARWFAPPRASDDPDDGDPGIFPPPEDDGTLSEDEEARMEREQRETAALESATGASE